MASPRDVLSLFETPVVVFDLPDLTELNRELATQLLVEEQRVPSWKRANVGGWHSTPDLGQRAAFRSLMQQLVEHVGQVVHGLAGDRQVPEFRYGVTSWAMIMRDGNYVMPHDHGDAHFSAAYYVDAGDASPPPSGALAFLDPRRGGRQIAELELFSRSFEIAPVTGSLVVFPGWLVHYVHAYRGARPRICVSANFVLEPG
jgi:uncharacterized protein (TIGR02466 family)